jgi:hypothetical protein
MTCRVDLSVEKGSVGLSQKDLKRVAPKTLKLQFGYSSYVGHFGLTILGPKRDMKAFLSEYIPWGAGFIHKGTQAAW